MPHRPSCFVAATFVVTVAAVFAGRAGAQCSTSWQPSLSLPGVDGIVKAMANWDPDGAGPATPVVVVAGQFSVAGSVVTHHLATYDPATGVWGALGAIEFVGWTTEVNALAVMPNGDLVVGGLFTTVDGIVVNNVARWNGTVWSALGAGIDGRIHALAVLPNGDLVAGGKPFALAGGFDLVARWNGTTWSRFGSGLPVYTGAEVRALAVMPNGDVAAGGAFWFGGALPWGCLARWNGSVWSQVGGGLGNYVNALAVAPNGDLFAGGEKTLLAGGENLSRWDGSTWSTVGAAPFPVGPVRSLALLPNGDLIAGGGEYGCSGIAKWNGTAWSGLGIDSPVHALVVLPNGELLAGGEFGFAGTLGARNIARWNGATWSPLGSGFSAGVLASATMPNGDLVVGGDFGSIGAIDAKGVARYDGVSWAPVGTGLNGSVFALAVLPNGDLVVGGRFEVTGAVSRPNVARWDGATWQAMANGLGPPGISQYEVKALAVLPNGDLVAGGDFGPQMGFVARWNGATWSPLVGLTGGLAGPVLALRVLPNGNLVAGGPNFVKRFDGGMWASLGGAFNQAVSAIAVLPNGDLVAGGRFTSVAGVAAIGLASWDGVSWHALGGLVYASIDALEVLPGGNLAVGGVLVTTPGTATRGIGRWDGTGWAPMPDLSENVATLAMVGTELVVGGSFTAASGAGVSGFVRLATSCPANVGAFGSGCTGSGGPNVLSATSLPWLGSTFSAGATGMPVNGLALVITGFGAVSLPLSSILPQGGAGCFLLATPDVAAVALPVGGTVATALAIPASLGLVGQVFHQQVVPLEFDALGAISALTSTNRLTARIGRF